MGPHRTKRARVDQGGTGRRRSEYDLSLPENWTVAKLCEKLSAKGVAFSKTLKKSQLIALYKQVDDSAQGAQLLNRTATVDVRSIHGTVDGTAEVRSGSLSEEPVSALPSQSESTLFNAIRELTNTVKELKDQIHSRGSDERTSKTVPSAAGSESQELETRVPADRNSGSENETYRPTPTSSSTAEKYNLHTAYACYTANEVSTRTVQQNLTMDSVNGNNTVRTKYGFAAGSLPHVNTISPALRKAIIEDGQISQVVSHSKETPNTMFANRRSIENLNQDINGLWNSVVSSKTAKTYGSAIQHFLRFMTLS